MPCNDLCRSNMFRRNRFLFRRRRLTPHMEQPRLPILPRRPGPDHPSIHNTARKWAAPDPHMARQSRPCSGLRRRRRCRDRQPKRPSPIGSVDCRGTRKRYEPATCMSRPVRQPRQTPAVSDFAHSPGASRVSAGVSKNHRVRIDTFRSPRELHQTRSAEFAFAACESPANRSDHAKRIAPRHAVWADAVDH